MLFASKLIFVSFHQQESYSTAVDRMYEFVQEEDVWIINSCNMEPVKLFFAERERERGCPGVFLFLFNPLFLS
jgi:S-adenosylmethionine:tRNA-ribosyltransferase-isomerase (queuine synthetase)